MHLPLYNQMMRYRCPVFPYSLIEVLFIFWLEASPPSLSLRHHLLYFTLEDLLSLCVLTYELLRTSQKSVSDKS